MSVVLGVLLAIIAYSMLNVGQALQKKAASELPEIENTDLKGNLKNFLTNKVWLVGWLMTTVQWYIYLFALPMAPLSLLSAMMGVGLVVLVVFSALYLKEKVSKTEIIGVFIIIVGVVMLATTNVGDSGSSTAETLNLTETNLLMAQPKSIILTIILLVLVVVPILYSKSKNYAHADVIFGITAGLLGGIGSIYSKAFMSGLSGEFSVWETIATWQWYIYILLLFIGNMGLAPVQQVGFQKGKAVIVAPLTTISTLIVSIIGGIISYSEWDGLSNDTITLKIISMVIIVLGVGILSFLRKNEEPNSPIANDNNSSETIANNTQ